MMKLKYKRILKIILFLLICVNIEQVAMNSLVDNVNGEDIGIRKYFIKAKDIKEAYILFRQKHEMKTLPDKNLYDYGESESNKDDEVGTYYIHDIKGKFWVIGMGYDSGSITIYRQTKDYIEVIYQWSIDW